MNKTEQSTTPAHHSRTSLRCLVPLVAALLVLLGPWAASVQAQDCSPTPPVPTPTPGAAFNYGPCTTGLLEDEDPENPDPGPPLEFLPSEFQPPDGSQLGWQKYIPDGDGPFPTIIMIHGDGFHHGNSNEENIAKIATQLKNSGYLVLAVNFRLALCGRIHGQDPEFDDPASGRPPEQTDDIKSFVRAARATLSTLCDGEKIGLLGGSGGGGHAAFVALDKTPSPADTYPNWCQNGADDRPNCAACLSGL